MPVSGDTSPFSSSTTSNWVARAGGLPDRVRAIARAIQRKNPEWPLSRCIATAVNAIKYSAATGDAKLPGRQNEHPDVVIAHQAAVTEWELKKAKAHLDSAKGKSNSSNSTKAAQPRSDALSLASAFDSAAHPRADAGTATGGQFVAVGQAKDAAGAKAQKDAKAAANYKTAMTSKDPAAFLKGLSDADLKALTAYAYSAHSSDPNIVKLRIAIAAEMGKRGFDVKQFGALGGGLSTKGKPSSSKSSSGSRKSSSSKSSSGKLATVTSPNKPGMVGVTYGSITEAQWNKLLSMGYNGDPTDGRSAIYAPASVITKVTGMKTAHEQQAGLALATPLIDSQSGSKVTVLDTSKAAPTGSGSTSTKLDAASRRKMAKQGIALKDGSFPVANQSDLANAIAAHGRANKSKQPMVKAHIVKRAKAIGAEHKLPADWKK